MNTSAAVLVNGGLLYYYLTTEQSIRSVMLVIRTCQRKAVKASHKKAKALRLTSRAGGKPKLKFLRSTTKNKSPTNKFTEETELKFKSRCATSKSKKGSHRHGKHFLRVAQASNSMSQFHWALGRKASPADMDYCTGKEKCTVQHCLLCHQPMS